MKRYNDYDTFAWLYNREWSAVAENIFPFLKLIAGDKIPDGGKILDLCCGTGQLAKVLTGKGYKVTGIDGSAGMLRYARENAPAAKFILKDARAFKLPPEYDVVFSTFDALNHVMTFEGLERVFKNVFECLASGGIFLFDMTMKDHFEGESWGHQEIREKPEYLFVVRPEYDSEKRLSTFKCTVFQPEGKLWKRSDIILYQTWYPFKDIKSALKRTGFNILKTRTFNRQREIEEATENSPRVFFCAQKP
jgi:SAM-dependent methyltransferase